MVWNLKCVLSRCVESPWYPCMWPGVHFLLFSQPPATNKPAAGEALDPAEAAWRVRAPSPPCGVAPPSEVMLGSRLLLSQHLYTCWVWLVQWERYDTLSFVSRESRVVRPSDAVAGVFLPEPPVVLVSVLLLCWSQLLDLSVPVKTRDSSSLFITGFYYNTEVIYG